MFVIQKIVEFSITEYLLNGFSFTLPAIIFVNISAVRDRQMLTLTLVVMLTCILNLTVGILLSSCICDKMLSLPSCACL
jgi:hypothetical protein